MTPSDQSAEKIASHYLARQPILNSDEGVLGYELLYRESAEQDGFTADRDTATRNIIGTLNVIGLDTVCDGRIAFINCTSEMLLKEFIYLLPANRVVVEVQETVRPDDSVIAACQNLKRKNYKIALDNFVSDDPRESLIPYSDFIKIDIRKCMPERNAAIVAKYAKRCRAIAQRVETRQQKVDAERGGFAFFQGYFFHRPERMRARSIEGDKTSHLRLLQAVTAPQVDLSRVEDLIKRDASLCYQLLRYLNSPVLGVQSPVKSIQHGITLLGERELVRWVRMATTLVLGAGKCSDLVLSSLVRARFCELISPKVERCKPDLFLVGMLSLMDAILDIPMGVVVEGLALDQETKLELLGAKKGSNTPLTPIYRLMLARESGEWEDVTVLSKTLGLSLPFVNRSYNEAMSWAREMVSDGVRSQDHSNATGAACP